MRFKLLVLCAMIACSASAGAQSGEEPRACVRDGAPGQDYERDSTKDWQQEAQRVKSNEQMVSRQRDRLRLALDGGKTVELADCPYGDGAYRYLYERYDQAGGFHVIRTQARDDFSYTLVLMRTGRLFTVHGAPVWASDKSRFLTVACSLLPPRGSLVIQTSAGDGLATEAEIRAALRDGKLFGPLGSSVVDRGDVHAARGFGQEGHGVRRHPRRRRQLEEVRPRCSCRTAGLQARRRP